MPLSIIIVGAGIGGLTTALALADRGHEVKIVEQRTNLSEPGAGLQLSPNASRLLIDLGFGNALERIATEPRRSVIRDGRSGRFIGEVAQGHNMRRRFGAPYWVVHRADLHAALLDAARAEPSISLKIGRCVQTIRQDEEVASIKVANTNGSQETMNADLIIGADGIWSKTRKALGDKRSVEFSGYVAWRATISHDRMPEALMGNETGLWLGRKFHVVHYPIAGGRKINIVAIQRRRKPVDGWATPGDSSELLATFGKSVASDLHNLLALPEEWLLWSLYDLPARRLAQGRVALVGDAAHPVLPFLAQGAAMAIEDAIMLASELAYDGVDLSQALARYERSRLIRIQRIQKEARKNGRIYHASGLVASGRNFVIGHLGPQGMTDRYSWLYGWSPDNLSIPG